MPPRRWSAPCLSSVVCVCLYNGIDISLLVFQGTSVEDVRAKVETDVYWTGNVVSILYMAPIHYLIHLFDKWDKEKLVILPYLTPSVYVVILLSESWLD